MRSAQIKLYDLFRKELNLPDDKAAAFVTAVEEVVEREYNNEKSNSATKDDISILRDSIHLLELKIEQSKGDIYKAMFWTRYRATSGNFGWCPGYCKVYALSAV